MEDRSVHGRILLKRILQMNRDEPIWLTSQLPPAITLSSVNLPSLSEGGCFHSLGNETSSTTHCVMCFRNVRFINKEMVLLVQVGLLRARCCWTAWFPLAPPDVTLIG